MSPAIGGGRPPASGSAQHVKVLILWADDASPNLGVRALGRGTEALVRRVWPDALITFVNYGHGSPHLPLGRLRSLMREQVTGRLGMQEWLSAFDLVVDTRSGDSFSDIYGMKRHAVMTAVAACVFRSGVPLLMGPQTIGPFGSRRARTMARHSLRGAKLVMARDVDSAAEASRLGRGVDVLTTDVVFAIDTPAIVKSRDVILNLSGLLWNPNPHVDFLAYREVIRELHNCLLADGRTVTLLAHVLESNDGGSSDNDVPAIREFITSTHSRAEVLIPSNLDDVRTAVASGNAVIGSRMHACLNALSVGTPAIPLAYSRKFSPLLRGLGWGHTVDLRQDALDPVEAALQHLAHPNLAQEVVSLVASAKLSLIQGEQSLRSLL